MDMEDRTGTITNGIGSTSAALDLKMASLKSPCKISKTHGLIWKRQLPDGDQMRWISATSRRIFFPSSEFRPGNRSHPKALLQPDKTLGLILNRLSSLMSRQVPRKHQMRCHCQCHVSDGDKQTNLSFSYINSDTLLV